jgi:hypothetical protein
MSADVFAFPRTSRELAKLASLRPAPVADHPMRGAFGHPPVEPVEERSRVDITGGMDGCTVWLLGRPYKTGLTVSNASRIGSALMTLDSLDALPGQHPTPTEAVRAMLAASVATLGDEPGPEAA